jgi:hypothetical protein
VVTHFTICRLGRARSSGESGTAEQDVNDGLGRQPWHRGRTDLLDLDGATAERGADASSLAGEKLRQ